MTLSEYVRNILNKIKDEYKGSDKNVIRHLCIYWHNVGYSYSNISNVSDKDFIQEVNKQVDEQ